MKDLEGAVGTFKRKATRLQIHPRQSLWTTPWKTSPRHHLGLRQETSDKQSQIKMPKSKGKELLVLDGRTLEGGGQLIRVAFCLSALTGKAVQVNDIRGKRSGGGGLKPQHLVSE